MNRDDERKFFPSNLYEAIAFLYVQNQNLKGLTVEEIKEMYIKALNKLFDKDQI